MRAERVCANMYDGGNRKMSDANGKKEQRKVPEMLAAALSSADQVVRDLNSAHSKKTATSGAGAAGSGVHAQTDGLYCSPQK